MDWLVPGITAICCVIIAILCIKSSLRINKFLKALNGMPGPPVLPIVGTIQNVGVTPEKLIQLSIDMHKEHGSIFRFVTSVVQAVVVAKAEYFETILSNTEEITKSMAYMFLQPWLGTGLLTGTGAKWHSHRKMFTPTFHFKILESFVDTFNEKSQILIYELGKKTPGTEFDMYPFTTLCTLDIICETAMGVNMNTQVNSPENNNNAQYISAIYVLSEATIIRMFRPWLYPDWWFYNLSSTGRSYSKALKSLHQFTKKVVAEKSAIWRKNKERKEETNKEDEYLGIKKKQAFLDLLLEASESENKLTEAELREEVDTFMFEGHDTTTAAISWCLLLLGNHQEIQDKVVEELNRIFQGQKRKITMTDLKEMKYLELVVKETLRLYPSVPFIGRKLNNDLKLGEYVIPANTEVRLGIYNIHRSPEYYSDPDVFNPDNFLPEKVKERHPFAYVPFSAGPRNCIGQKFAMLEEKTILASILLNFRIESVEKMEDIIAVPELILRPKSGLKVKLYPRSLN